MLIKFSTVFLALTALLVTPVEAQGDYLNKLVNGFLLQPQLVSSNVNNIMREVGTFLAGNKETLLTTAGSLLTSGLDAIPSNVTSAICTKHFGLFIKALLREEEWAVRMFDAFGKPGSGTKDYSYRWIGSYDECVKIQATEYTDPVKKTSPSHPFTAKYCMISFPLSSMPIDIAGLSAMIGTCFPDTCTNDDVKGIVDTILEELPKNLTRSLPEPIAECQEKSLPLTDKVTATICVCVFFLTLMVVATAYDLIIHNIVKQQKKACKKLTSGEQNGHVNYAFHESDDKVEEIEMDHVICVQDGQVPRVSEKIQTPKDIAATTVYKPGAFGQLLLAFSTYTNAKKIVNTHQPQGTLKCVNGIRFLSMTWVILGHNIAFGLITADNLSTFSTNLWKRFTFQAIGNATFCVDSFFVLSGLLVAYLSLKDMKRRGGPLKFNWLMFYVHRFWRLTPPYMLFLMLHVTTFKYWASGPMWPQHGNEINECKDTWWTNLLYINNVYKVEKQCMSWTWYLANDMQFYVISPLLLVPLFYSPVLGSICCLAVLTGSTIARGIISYKNGFGPNIYFNEDIQKVMFDMYYTPWCRVGPYVLGLWTGYLLYKNKCKVKLPTVVVVLGWTISTALALTVLYGLYNKDGAPDLSKDISSLYNATSRIAWAASLSWLIFACATGYGGPVNSVLSWPGIIPLSRLTYCAYLVHPVVQDFYFKSRKNLRYWDDVEIVFLHLGVLCVSYAVAFVVSLSFESPMMGLEKVLLGRKKHS